MGAATVGGVVIVDRALRPTESGSDPVAITAAVDPKPAVPQGAPAVTPPDEEAAPEPEPDPSAAGPKREAAKPRSTETPRGITIREEVRLLDRARAALRSNDPDKSLALLATYASRFPRGELREEAAVIRIEALRSSGRDRAATRAEQKFQKRYPESAHQLDPESR
jgi:hypothetical protein